MQKVLKKLIDVHEVESVERHLFFKYINDFSLDIKDSILLKNYFQDFQEDYELLNELKKIKIENFIQLEKSQELLIPKSDRELNGAFFTPRRIVDKIVLELNPNHGDKCVDISCGCGAFLIGLLKFFQTKYSKSISEIVKENIYGYDILDYNIRRAKVLIALYALERGEIINDDDFNLEVGDSLRKNWNVNFEIVVGNPPYVKYQDLDSITRQFLLENFNSITKGTFNLYFAFFELGQKLLTNEGKLGFITPNNYFTSLSGGSLREFFQKDQIIYKVVDFSSKKVFEALTYTCLTFLNKRRNKSIEFNKYFEGDFEDFLDSYDSNLSEVKYSNLNPKKWRLLLNKDQRNINIIESIGTKLGDLFTINVGIATLRDDLYFIDGKDKRGFFKDYNGKKFYIEEDLVKSLYKISDFSSQEKCDNNDRKIIFPYKVLSGKSIVLQESDLKALYPSCFSYFELIKKDLLNRSKKEILNPYFQYGRSQGLNKFGLRLLTPTFSNTPSFFKVTEVDSLYCNGYGVHYKVDQGKQSLFDNFPIQDQSNIDILQRILNSSIMDYYVKTTSVTIDGGYPCYQKNFIELFNIPYLSQHELDTLRTLNDSEFNEKLTSIYDVNLS